MDTTPPDQKIGTGTIFLRQGRPNVFSTPQKNGACPYFLGGAEESSASTWKGNGVSEGTRTPGPQNHNLVL